MRITIDRDLPVPVGIQIQGLIEYGVSNGDFQPGSRLPSVRDLAAELGVSPVTVSQAYATLRAKGLIETLPGSGTFVREALAPQSAPPTHARVDALMAVAVQTGLREGLDSADLLERFHRVLTQERRDTTPLHGALVGIFPGVTQAYAADLRRHLRPSDTLVATTVDALRAPDGAAALAGVDFVLTLAHRLNDVASLVPRGVEVATIQLIPSERTRTSLAELDPLARVVLVSTFSEFLATFRTSVGRFASHVEDVRAVVLGTPEAKAAVAQADVVVYGTGSEAVLDGMPARIRSFEFRHVPDPIHAERTLLPFLESVRTAKAGAAPLALEER